MITIWQRYFIKEVLKTLLLFLFCFYGLYVLIDYSNHAGSFHKNLAGQWHLIGVYYLSEFSKRLNIFLPFAILISVIRTLCNLTVHHELVAMMASGIKLKTLLRPFFILGIFFTCLLYLNEQYLKPEALKHLKHIDTIKYTQKKKLQQQSHVQHLVLKDQSTLLFLEFDNEANIFFDVYWIRSFDEIYHIQQLQPLAKPPQGHDVVYLTRNNDGKLLITDHFEAKQFPDMRFNRKSLIETMTQPEELSLSKLWSKLPTDDGNLSEKQSQILSSFYIKLAMPWLCLLAVIGPAPFCVQYSRNLKIFFIYACSIFGLVAFTLILDSAQVLGERQVLSPSTAIGVPFGIIMGIFLLRYMRLR